jgi:hypothetical protein
MNLDDRPVMRLEAPTHPRMRWERYRQWCDGEWIWMLIWKHQDQVAVTDVPMAMQVAATAKARLYPQFERFGTNELEWVLGFGQELVAKGLLNPEAEGKPLAVIPPLLAERAAAARAMEAVRATDQLENGVAPPGPAMRWISDADLDEMMHQAEIEDEMDAMPVDTMFSHAPGMR